MDKFPSSQFNSLESKELAARKVTMEELCKLGPNFGSNRNAAATSYLIIKYITPKADARFIIDSLLDTDGDTQFELSEDQIRQTIERLKQNEIIAENSDGSFRTLVDLDIQNQS